MEEKLNIFGSNHSEVGSLSENLVLNTAGKVKIRFGLKFIDLIDDKGNINVKIPKVLTKVNSKDEIDSTGFYLLDGDLYVNIDGELIQITGVEGEFISYGIELNLTQELIELAQKNIGLTFPTIKDAQKAITKGIVFVDGRMYYINGGAAKEIPLNDPLIGINDAGLSEHPLLNNSAILWLEGSWKYVPIITYLELEDFKKSLQLDEEEEEEEESEEEESIFDPIQYSKVYTLKSFGLEVEEYATEKFKATGANFSTLPSSKLQNNDICIISVNGVYCTLNGNTIEPETKRIKTTYEVGLEEFLNESGSTDENAIKEYCNTQDSGTDLYSKTTYEIEEGRNIVIFTNESDRPAEEIYTFNFRYKDGELVFIDKNGSEVEYPITEVTYEELKLYVFTFGEDHYAVRKTAFNNKHLYVKAEQSKKEKFKIDYNNAEIALEENYPTDSEGETDEDKNKPKIIPHTVLGDLDDKSEYYNSPAKSFRTYKEKENSLGLFSDLAVFVGTEFRLPLDYKEPEIPEEESEETEIEYSDTEVYNFPRYSKILNEILCTKHKLEDFEEDDPFEDVVPTIRWIKNNSALNKPLSIINETEFDEEIESVKDDDNNEVPIGIVRVGNKWLYMHIVPWEVFKKCCDEMKSAVLKFTISWYTAEGVLYTTTQVSSNTSAVPPSTNPTKKHWKFTGWDYDDSPVTENISIYAKWEYIPPKVYISVSPTYLTNLGGSATVSYYVEWDGEIITEGITVEGTYSNIDYEEDGESYILDNKVNKDLIIKESTFSVLGKIYFLAKFMGEEGDEEGMGEVTAETVLLQRPAGALALPDFDLMKFSMEWTNTVDSIPEDSFQYNNNNWKWENNKLYELVEGSWVESDKLQAWEQDGLKYIFKTRTSTDSNWISRMGDLDTYTYTNGTNIPITEEKTLENYPVGFRGNSSRTINGSYLNNTWTVIVRKELTKLFNSDYDEFTEETITAGKDIYDAYLYLTWSGDNTTSGGEYTVINFKKIINSIVRNGLKAVFFYIKAGWYTWNGTGDFDVLYNIYKLNLEDKGLISPRSTYDFNAEDSSVETIPVSNNKLLGLHNVEGSGNGSVELYGNPVATLYYDLSTQEITFIQGYYTEEDIYGKGTSSDTFIWKDNDEE